MGLTPTRPAPLKGPMRLWSIAALLCLALMVAACTKPVSYYAAHADERQTRLQACLIGPDNNSQDCRNAAQAEFDALGVKAVNGRAVPPSNSN